MNKESKIIDYLFNEFRTESEKTLFEHEINQDSALKREIEELAEVKPLVQKSIAKQTLEFEEVSSVISPDVLERLLYNQKKNSFFERVMARLQIENPYFKELLFIVVTLLLSIVEINDVSNFSFNSISIKDLSKAPSGFISYTNMSFLCCFALMSYILALMNRIYKEVQLVESFRDISTVNLGKTATAPLSIFRVIYFLVFLTLLVLF